MKEIKLFYLVRCPHCLDAMHILDKLLKEEKYQGLSVEMIEESIHREIAAKYDYYYVPTFYVGDDKMAEGALSEEQIRNVLDHALC